VHIHYVRTESCAWGTASVREAAPMHLNTMILAFGERWNGEQVTSHGGSQPLVSNEQ
jgi:hypothetical protein